MFFWRVENSKGKGPYHNIQLFQELLYKHNTDDKHPIESHLIDQAFFQGKIFGFKTKESAKAWFSEEEFKIMAEFGYHLKKMKGTDPVYSCYEYKKGIPCQLVFKRWSKNENK